MKWPKPPADTEEPPWEMGGSTWLRSLRENGDRFAGLCTPPPGFFFLPRYTQCSS